MAHKDAEIYEDEVLWVRLRCLEQARLMHYGLFKRGDHHHEVMALSEEIWQWVSGVEQKPTFKVVSNIKPKKGPSDEPTKD